MNTGKQTIRLAGSTLGFGALASALIAYTGPIVDLHARLPHLLQPGNDPHAAMQIAMFSKIQVAADGSVLNAINGRFWVIFRCKSTDRDDLLF